MHPEKTSKWRVVKKLWVQRATDQYRSRLLGLLAQPGDQIVPVLALLQATESHLGAGDVFLGVLEIFELAAVS